MESTPCRLCANLPGCPHLARQEEFLRHKVIDENTNPGVCEDFVQMGEAEAWYRETMYNSLGDGYLRAVHLFPRSALQDIKEENEEMVEVPDFAGMIREGMTVEDRLEQFMYETDDDGNFVTDNDGNKIPRGMLPVLKYAADPSGPVGPPTCETIAYWDFDEVLKEVIKAEKKLYGLGGKKASKKKQPKKAEVETAEAKPEKKKETFKMAIKPRITLRKKDGPAPGGATDNTPSKVKGKVSKAATTKKKGGVKKPNGHTEEAETAAAESSGGASLDYGKVGKLIDERVKPLEEKLDAILAALGEGPNGRPIAQTVTDAATALHDALQQKASNLYFNLLQALSEDGPTTDDDGNPIFTFLEGGDGRDSEQNLMEDPENATDVISYYLDGAEEEGEEGEEEETED